LKQRERTISLNGGWLLHLREGAKPTPVGFATAFMMRAIISHDLMQ
jgi:hypothetical protein